MGGQGTTTSSMSATGGGGTGGVGGAATGGGGTSGVGGAATGGGGAGGVGGQGGAGGMPLPPLTCDLASGPVGSLKVTQLAGNLSSPMLVKTAPGDPDRLYVVERVGRIGILKDGHLIPKLFLNVPALVLDDHEEQGLLGLAFHPNYAQNGRFFIHYSAEGSGDSTVQEFKRSIDPLVAEPGPVQLVLKHPTAQLKHNGGSIEFGQDGYLYVALGDGGSQGDPECDAQNPNNLLGKISRVDVDAAPDADGYPAAPGNPGGAKQYHLGLRNPWRMSVDPCSGMLYIGDVGQMKFEEIDVAPTSPPSPRNFGWPFREGMHDFANACPPSPGPWDEPILVYDHDLGCSVTGGYVYRGSAIPWLRGAYIYGDFCTSRVWMIKPGQAGGFDPPALLVGVSQQVGHISSFGQDGHGEIYVVGFDGTLHRIDPG